MPKRAKGVQSSLIDFHVQMLLKLLEDEPGISEAVKLLRDSITIVQAGASPQILRWHLDRVRKMVPNNVGICDAVDMLSECIIYRDKL